VFAASQPIRRIEGTTSVFLTFDAGADRGYASEILDLLATDGVRASFGFTGEWASANPDIVRRIADEGHTIINHSFDHPSFTGASSNYVVLRPDERQAQLASTDAVIQAVAGTTSMPYFRPPDGDVDESVLSDVGAAGYRYTILWSIDSGGWRGLPASEIIARMSVAGEGDVVIMHVASAEDFAALPEILDTLRSRGLRLAGLAEALR
jgi:peptidoglycan/xylan/chitin deacetylase (PgdA/CDA1 family)